MTVLRVWNGIGRKPPLQRADKEEPKAGSLCNHRSDRQFAFVQQISLPLTDMVRTEF